MDTVWIRRIGLLSLLALGVWNRPAFGQAFPTRPIELVVPFAAGGGSDILARAMAKVMAEERLLPVPLVVTNRPGGSGAVGWGYVLSKRGDPYFLATVSSSFWTTPLVGQAPFTFKDFTPVAGVARDTYLYVVRTESAYRTLRDVITVARQSPELISIGGSAAASDDRVATGLLQRAANVRFNYIPFGGTGPALTALLGGHVSSTWINPGEGLEHIKANKIRALALTSSERLRVLPDVPTFRELGYDLTWEQFRGVVMAPGVPADAVRVMSEAFVKLCRSARWHREYVEPNVLVGACQGPEEFARTLEVYNERYRRTFQDLGVIR
ncbi:MAG: tripartite tricarboxylate transporter substrate binding protein [Armatimonadota bacterium]|nr:tripartite tricarboxylate transporter substrate binding protein [Armatimonadota bacterium]